MGVQNLIVVFPAEINHCPKDANIAERAATQTDFIIDRVDFKLERRTLFFFLLELLSRLLSRLRA